MSVKLVIVALLAAAVTTTQAAKVATVKTCDASDTKCACDATDSNTKKFPVGKCELKNNVHWKVDSCEDGKDVVAKGYADDTCTPGTWTVSTTTCKAIAHHQATCNSDKSKVSLVVGCTGATCTAGAGGCSAAVEFTFGEDPCVQVGKKYYKLTSANCDEDTVSFTEYSNGACTQDGVAHKVPTTCGPSHFRKGTCGTGQTSFKTCTTNNCDADDDTCKTQNVELKTATLIQAERKYLYIDSCAADQDLAYQVYADWVKYSYECTEDESQTSHQIVTCEEPTTASTMTESSSTETSSTETSNTETSSSSSSSSSTGDNNGSNGSDSNNSTDEASLAPVHSMGALAFVLCLLAYAY